LKARIRTILDDWKEYKDATLETFKPRTIQQERALRMMTASPGSSFFIKGIYSQGKTRLLVCQYRRLAEQGVRCEIRTARDLVKELQLAEAPAEVGKTAFESPILKLVNLSPSGHLFIDDIEKAGVRSGFRAESLFHLFDTIKRRQIGLTVTTNLPMQAAKKGEKDLKTEMTDQVVSRLDQICSDIIDLG
jgi:DNA replication protein DnaC